MDSFTIAPAFSTFNLRLRNVLASAAFVALAWAGYRFVPSYRRQLDDLYGPSAFAFTGADFLLTGAVVYIVLLMVYFLTVPDPTTSKSLRVFRLAGSLFKASDRLRWRSLSRDDRIAVLATLLKVFFGPLMAMSLMIFCTGAISHGAAIAAAGISLANFQELFNEHGFWFLMQVIVFVDVLLFSIGYMVELPQLGNQIRSVDPTLLGWSAAILCYPPFNKISSTILGAPLSDFPHFDNPTAHLVLNFLLLFLMGVYSWASVSLGFKASNLTHRGIVCRGPYGFVRHPAYVCKNMAWWIGSMPAVLDAFGHSTFEGIQVTASVVGWTLLYVLRALTEEDHLRSVDGEYAAYAARVRYRFIPGLY